MAKVVNVEVAARGGEPGESLIRRFIKKMKKSGILDEYRERMYHEKRSDKKRRVKATQKRAAQRQTQEQKNNEKGKK